MIENIIGTALDTLFHGQEIATLSRERVAHMMREVAHRADAIGRDEALLSLKTTRDLADEWGVSLRRAQAIVKNASERWGVGMHVGRDWIVTPEEAERIRPGEPGRPRND